MRLAESTFHKRKSRENRGLGCCLKQWRELKGMEKNEIARAERFSKGIDKGCFQQWIGCITRPN